MSILSCYHWRRSYALSEHRLVWLEKQTPQEPEQEERPESKPEKLPDNSSKELNNAVGNRARQCTERLTRFDNQAIATLQWHANAYARLDLRYQQAQLPRAQSDINRWVKNLGCPPYTISLDGGRVTLTPQDPRLPIITSQMNGRPAARSPSRPESRAVPSRPRNAPRQPRVMPSKEPQKTPEQIINEDHVDESEATREQGYLHREQPPHLTWEQAQVSAVFDKGYPPTDPDQAAKQLSGLGFSVQPGDFTAYNTKEEFMNAMDEGKFTKEGGDSLRRSTDRSKVAATYLVKKFEERGREDKNLSNGDVESIRSMLQNMTQSGLISFSLDVSKKPIIAGTNNVQYASTAPQYNLLIKTKRPGDMEALHKACKKYIGQETETQQNGSQLIKDLETKVKLSPQELTKNLQTMMADFEESIRDGIRKDATALEREASRKSLDLNQAARKKGEASPEGGLLLDYSIALSRELRAKPLSVDRLRIAVNKLQEVMETARPVERMYPVSQGEPKEMFVGGLMEKTTLSLTEATFLRERSEHTDILALPLTTLSESVAKQIIQIPHNALQLNGLKQIDEATAAVLVQSPGIKLELNGLTSLPQDAANKLAQYRGTLSLDGLQDFKTAKGLIEARKRAGDSREVVLRQDLSLRGLRNIDKDEAQELSTHHGTLMLEDMAAEGLRNLRDSNFRGSLELRLTHKPPPDVLTQLQNFKSLVFVRLTNKDNLTAQNRGDLAENTNLTIRDPVS